MQCTNDGEEIKLYKECPKGCVNNACVSEEAPPEVKNDSTDECKWYNPVCLVKKWTTELVDKIKEFVLKGIVALLASTVAGIAIAGLLQRTRPLRKRGAVRGLVGFLVSALVGFFLVTTITDTPIFYSIAGGSVVLFIVSLIFGGER